ncbi:amidohydrolase family protein [Calorimonas adulescens]|uniref:Amidohydrolase family protein n=1 Tax=Calorimonas adulescens TaxID=2606906 RepID=A0A5D8QDG9_9THEO|nr:amidohydrolase family protein [Calorimonas adulescens]TZE81563.1 amidohydrolase family protein [Calorimonas adulescens]
MSDKRVYVDAHIHISLNGENSRKLRAEFKEKKYDSLKDILCQYRDNNILILRDGGDNLGMSLAARDIAQTLGIIYKTPGWAIYKKGGYGSFLGRPVEDISEFKESFKELLKVRPDHLKIILTGLVDFESYGQVGGIFFTFDELYYMIQSAKEKNLPVMVHANSSEAVRMAVLAGADTIEHGYFITEDELYLMRERNTVWVPTLSPLGNIKSCDQRYSGQISNIQRIYEGHLWKIKKALTIGVRIAVGSDAGSYRVHHVTGFFDEVMHLQKCGISKDKIYEMSFENGIKALGIKVNQGTIP